MIGAGQEGMREKDENRIEKRERRIKKKLEEADKKYLTVCIPLTENLGE